MPKTCFFVSRIGDPGSPERDFSDKLLRYIVEPVLEKAGYERAVRADHITQPGVITTQVFSHLWNDELVIADLTGSNPNVFYELAVRHIRRKPFVHMIQAGQRIPFDVAPNRTIEFDFDIEKADKAMGQAEDTGAADIVMRDLIGARQCVETAIKNIRAGDLRIIETEFEKAKALLEIALTNSRSHQNRPGGWQES